MPATSGRPASIPPAVTSRCAVALAVALAVVSLGGCTGAEESCAGDACVRPTACRAGEASAQFVRQQPPPSLLAPRVRAPVSVTFANCSGQTWTPGSFAMRPAGPLAVWGMARVELPLEVPDGHEITIPFDVEAPPESGAYAFTWAITHDGVERFQEPSPAVMVRVAAPADCSLLGPPARFLGQVAPPAFVATGSSVAASLRFANCSPEPWLAGEVALVSRGEPADAWGPTVAPLEFEVPPQREVTIPLPLTAPAQPGTCSFAWQLRFGTGEGRRDDWIEEGGPAVTVTALDAVECGPASPPARFLSQRAPDRIARGAPFEARVRFGNCSGEVWGAGFVIDSALPGRDHRWGAGPLPLPLAIGSGFAVELAFGVHAPAQHGTHPYRFGVYAPDGALLDEPTPPHDVAVTCVPMCGDHDCGGDGCGGSCGSCGNGWTCDGAHCKAPPPPPGLPCHQLQWWNAGINYAYINQYGWYDTDLNVRAGTASQLRHDSKLEKTGVYAWGYMPEFTDQATGKRFRMLHLRPQNQNATIVGKVYPAGFVVGISGGDTKDTGYPAYSTGAHLCIQTLEPYRKVFPAGQDACH